MENFIARQNRFIARQNIEHLSKLIENEPDLAQRRRLMQILAEQKAKLNSAETGPGCPAQPA